MSQYLIPVTYKAKGHAVVNARSAAEAERKLAKGKYVGVDIGTPENLKQIGAPVLDDESECFL